MRSSKHLVRSILALAAITHPAAHGETMRVQPKWGAPDGMSHRPSLTANGRYVAYLSMAENLVVPSPAGGHQQAYVFDKKKKKVKLVSISSTGFAGDGDTSAVAISAKGRYVTFASDASNLVAGDTNGTTDVFVRDLKKGVTTRVSVGSGGFQSSLPSLDPTISMNGRYVVFESWNAFVQDDGNGSLDVYLHDRKKNLTTRVSKAMFGQEPDGHSGYARISADGNHVAFGSHATNLVLGDDNSASDVFVYHRKHDSIELVSPNLEGSSANGASMRPAISKSGRWIAFSSDASDLVGGDSNGARDIFVRDLKKDQTERVSVNTQGVQANGMCYRPAISPKGRVIAFWGPSSSFFPEDINGESDVFLFDRKTKELTLASASTTGASGNGKSAEPAVSIKGKYVAFSSRATDLIEGDSNNAEDLFLRKK